MKVITQREFRNNSAAVMDAVEAGAAIVEFDPCHLTEMRPPATGHSSH